MKYTHLTQDERYQIAILSKAGHGRLSSNDGEIAMKLGLDGHGITLRSEWDICRHVAAGRLRLVLQKYSQIDADIYAVFPPRQNPR